MLQLDFESLEIVKLVKADLNTSELFILKVFLVWLLNFVALNCAFFSGFSCKNLILNFGWVCQLLGICTLLSRTSFTPLNSSHFNNHIA